jgi:putative sigma-54 modulation protein
MQVSVTFRHVDATPALKAHAEERLARLRKYLHRPGDAHVVLSVEKDRHTAEVTWQADHESLFAKEVTGDLYSAIDLVVAKLEHQAQRLKEKRETHKGPAREVATAGASGARGRAPGAGGADVVAEPIDAKPMALEDAVDRLERSGAEFLAFIDASTRAMAVLYRRKDGHYGLIESPRG